MLQVEQEELDTVVKVIGENGSAGTNGIHHFFNGTNLIVTSGLTYTLTSSVAENVETILVQNGGTFIVPDGVSASVTSFTTAAGSTSTISNNFTAGTIT